MKKQYTRAQLINYYKKQNAYNKIIKQDAREDKDVVYGTQALNAQIPSYLRRQTKDWDIFTRGAKKEAKELETKLDSYYGGDYFYVKPAQHEGTYKVESYVTGNEVADYTDKPKGIKSVKKNNIKYVPLSWIENSAKTTLKDKASVYRHEKDRDTLQRIKAARR